jgi:hypothetical protein
MLPKTLDRPALIRTPVKPCDCAIAICVPLDYETFVHALTHGEPGTFVLDNSRDIDKHLSPHQRWKFYEPLVRLISQVLDHVERRGVHVVRNATIEHFFALCITYPVVSLVAHWRSARFRMSDLVDTTALEALIYGDSTLRKLLLDLTGGYQPIDSLLAVLNLALDGKPKVSLDTSVGGTLSSLQISWYRSRQRIETTAPGHFRSGAAVEFSRGLCNVRDILAGLPEQTPSLLDLTICNSVLLAQAIHDAKPATHCLCNERRADLAVRMAFYRQVIDQLHRQDTTFEDACFDVRQHFKR